MIKNLISRLSVLAVMISFMASCSQNTEYTLVIPEDVTAIASINLVSLGEKAGLNNKEIEAVKQKIIDILKQETKASSSEQLEKIIKNPFISGIDIQLPIYLFSATSFPYKTLVAKVSDQENLRATIDALIKEQLCQPIAEAQGYSYTIIENNILAFTPTTLLLVEVEIQSQVEDIKNSISTLLKQTAENSISSNTGFKKMQQQKGDVNFLASMDAVPELYSSYIQIGLPDNVNPSEIMTLGNLNFEKGRIALQFKYYTENKELEAVIKKSEKAFLKSSTTLLQYFPASTLAFFNAGINGEELYNLLLENKEFAKNTSAIWGDEAKKLFGSFEGNIAGGLINFSIKESETAFLLYADIKNGDVLKTVHENKKLLKLGDGEDILQLAENRYVYKSRSTNVFFGILDKQFYATNNELLYKEIGKTVDKSIKSTNYASDIKGKKVFFVINIEAILELPIVKMFVDLGGKQYEGYRTFASQKSYFEISMDNDGKSEIVLVLKNKEVNALKQIVEFARQFAGI